MGLSKTEKFTDEQNRLSALAKALAHPARIAILQVLAKRKACVCGEIVEELPLSQSTISQHLKELKSAGIIEGTIEGPTVCYCIDENKWETLKNDFSIFLHQYTPANCC